MDTANHMAGGLHQPDGEMSKHEMMGMHTDILGKDDPQRWPFFKKVTSSLAATGYTFALLYGASSYTAGIGGVMKDFDVSLTKAILPFSLYIFGIIFAPLYSPHVSERLGRNLLYNIATIGLAAFTLGAAWSQTYVQLAVCRFFAGLLGGSNAVQIEGSYADVWPALYTGSYYAFIAASQYFGAATGAVVCWHVVPAESWRWTQYTTLMFCFAALLLGFGAPESYRRLLIRRKVKESGQADALEPPPTGATFGVMIKLTVVDPIKFLFTQPIVTMITLYLALNFAVLFSWFIAVPATLQGVANFTPQQVGLAFVSAIGGMALAAITVGMIDQAFVRSFKSKHGMSKMPEIEHRMIPAMLGACMLTASLFWVGWTANTMFQPMVPIIGTAFYVWGSAMVLIGMIGYLFDAFTPQATLSGLTTAACTRVGMAAAIPLCFPIAAGRLGGAWTLSTFGIISIVFLPFPFLLFFFGKTLRQRSGHFNDGSMGHGAAPSVMTVGEKTNGTERV